MGEVVGRAVDAAGPHVREKSPSRLKSPISKISKKRAV